MYTVKPVYNGHSKIDKTKNLMTNGSLMKVKSIAECSPWYIFYNTFDLHYRDLVLKNTFRFLREAVLHWFYCMSRIFYVLELKK